MAKKVSIVKATAIIVVTTALLAWTAHAFIRRKICDPHDQISRIVQTGPVREALKTLYLAELMEVSADRPPSLHAFDTKLAKRRLLSSPLIKEASVTTLEKEKALYIDYSVRVPLFSLFEYENTAVDEEGYLFPMAPFFSPKNLPELYLGLSAFGMPPKSSQLPIGRWHHPISCRHFQIALGVQHQLDALKFRDVTFVRRIDVSKALAPSLAQREVVLLVEDEFSFQDSTYIKPRYLRLSTKHYATELGNYLNLRAQLIEKERRAMPPMAANQKYLRLPSQVIDFRLRDLAFIEERKGGG